MILNIRELFIRERNNKSYRASYDTVLQSFSKKVQIQIIEENHCIMYTYFVRLTDDVEFNLQAEEVVTAKWLEISELENMKEDIVNSMWDRYLQFREKIMR